MKATKYLIALLALGALVACGGGDDTTSEEPVDSLTTESEPIDSGTTESDPGSSDSSTSSVDPDAEEKQAIAETLAALAETPFVITYGDTTFIRDPEYISFGDEGYILLEAYAMYDTIAYPYQIVDGELDVLVAELDEDGVVTQAIENTLIKDFSGLTAADIDVLDDDGNAVITDAENPVYGYFALTDEATGDLTVEIGEEDITLAFAGGLTVKLTEIGTAENATVATYLEEVGLPMGGIAPNYAMYLVYSNVYNSVTSFYPYVNGVLSETPEKVTMLDQSADVLHLYTEDDRYGLILTLAEEGEGTKKVNVTTDSEGNVTDVTYEDYIVDGNIVPWKEVGLTNDIFDITGFRLGYEIQEEGATTYDQYYQYYGWRVADCYFSSVRETLPEGQTINDLEIVIPRTSSTNNDRISEIRYETVDEDGNNGYLIVTEVAESPDAPEIPTV